MKNAGLAFIFIFISMFSWAQNTAYAEDQLIRKAHVSFVNTIKYKKLNETVASIYPKLFTIMPKDQFTHLLNFTYNNPFIKLDIQDMKFIAVNKPELVNGEYFSIADYQLKLRADGSTMNKEMRKQVADMLTKKYGKEHVKMAGAGIYLINTPMKALAISKNKKDWKILLAETETKNRLQKILPKPIFDKL